MQLAVGPLRVKAEAAEVAAFCAATPQSAGALAPAELPFTFPIRWLACDEIRAAVKTLVAGEEESALLPLHESQSFDYAAPLFAATDYSMHVRIHRQHEPAQLVLRAEIGPPAGSIHLRMEMVLRLMAANTITPADRTEAES